MRRLTRIPATRSISAPGWVGSEADLDKVVGFFEDVRNELLQTLEDGLVLATPELRAEQASRHSWLEGDELTAAVGEAVERHNVDLRESVALEMTLSEEVRHPANDPRRIIETADLIATQAFALEVRPDYKARPFVRDTVVSLDARPSGVTGSVTSADRTFIDGTSARLEKLLETTKPPRVWMVSAWFAALTSALAALALTTSAFIALSRFLEPSRDNIALYAYTALLVVFIVTTVHSLWWSRWRKNFPLIEVYRDGDVPNAEKASKTLKKAAGWTATAVVVPIILSYLFGS